MPIDLVAIADAVLAPLYDPVGVQGLAYGLLGLKTIRRVIDFGREYLDPDETRSRVSETSDEDPR